MQSLIELLLQSVSRRLGHVRTVREFSIGMQALLNGFVRVLIELPLAIYLLGALILALSLLQQLTLITVLGRLLYTTVLRILIACRRCLAKVASDSRLLSLGRALAGPRQEFVSMIRSNRSVSSVVDDLLDRLATVILLVILLNIRVVVDSINAVCTIEV